MSNSEAPSVDANQPPASGDAPEVKPDLETPVEIGGRDGPDPVRYGDWEKNGRCIDF